MRLVATYIIGLVFGLGITLSGMSNPAKVINFFDVAGTWDPSLAFVMGGALIVTFIGYRLVFRAKAPICEPQFYVPNRRDIDAKLVGGSAIFGVGWGITGFCPGGAVPAIGTGDFRVLTFAASMVAGMFLARWLTRAYGRIRFSAQPAE